MTPGKWNAEKWSDDGQESQIVASHCGKRSLICAGVMTDDARLIAAAPDLLEALANLTDWHLSGPEPTRFWDAARAAIAKATGK